MTSSTSQTIGDQLAELGRDYVPLKATTLYEGCRYASTSDVAANAKAIKVCLRLQQPSLRVLVDAFKVACDRLRSYEKTPEAMAHVMIKLLHRARWRLSKTLRLNLASCFSHAAVVNP